MIVKTYTPTNQANARQETFKFTLGLGIAIATLIGIWGTACLASAMVSMGPLSVVKAYFTAWIG